MLLTRRKFLSHLFGVAGGTAAGVGTESLFPSLKSSAETNAQTALANEAVAIPESVFKVAVITDEIAQDFGHACEVASSAFGMRWVELRELWNKNILSLDATEVAEAKRILRNYGLRVTDIASPLFKVDWPGAPLSKYSQRDEFNAGFTFAQQEEVLERAIESAQLFATDRVRCFDFWRLENQEPYRNAINERLRAAAEKAGGKGIILMLENEESCNTSTGGEAAKVLAAVKVPTLMLNWDPANAAACGEKAYPDGYRQLPKERIGHCHCKDLMRRGREYEWKAMGQGIVDWVGQFQGLRRDGYRAAVSLETHWDGGGTAEQCSRKSWAGMKALLQKAGAL